MKPIVTKIEIHPDELEELGEYMTDIKRKGLIKQYAGGLCLGCDEIPTKLVSYDISDEDMSAKRLEGYCDNCFEKCIILTNGRDETTAIRDQSNI